jgi:endonuclease/exonuclease/phosphatase family metal-dependent hydrolase
MRLPSLANSFGVSLFAIIVSLPVYGWGEDLSIRVTTWNLEWFPSGSKVEAPPAEQTRRIEEAASILRTIDPDIVLLQEVRDYEACVRLGEAIRPGMYHVAICSAFREPLQRGIGKQQVAILAKYQAQAAWTEQWRSKDGVDPPRGFAFAWFKIGKTDIGVYSLHLKSNLVVRGIRDVEMTKNIRKREVAIEQLLGHVSDVIGLKIPSIRSVIIGGDFNTNQDQEMFANENTLRLMENAGYQCGFELLPLTDRVTHPRNHGYPDATFDYVFSKCAHSNPMITQSSGSDHFPVTFNIVLPK